LDYNLDETIELSELCDAWHLHIDTTFLVSLILNATNICNLDDTLLSIQRDLYNELCAHLDDNDYIFGWINTHVSVRFIIERMIMNALSVKAAGKSILIPTYKCALSGGLEVTIGETDFNRCANDPIIGNGVIIGETELDIEITAIADSTIDYSTRVGSVNGINYNGAV